MFFFFFACFANAFFSNISSRAERAKIFQNQWWLSEFFDINFEFF